MAVNGGVAVLLVFFLSEVLGHHNCERPCQDSDPPKECYYHFTVNVALQRCVSLKNGACRRRAVLSINGQSPGPVISVCLNDTITVDVKNNLPSGMETSIHWHGLRQRATPHMDGVPMITQCPIHSGTTFRYHFIADRPGSFYYHAHSVLQQIDGLHGALIVYPSDTTGKVIFLAPQTSALTSLQSGFFTDLSVTELRSYEYNSEGPPSRFKLINAAALDCPLTVVAGGRTMTVLAVDGNEVTPSEVTHFVLHPGERADILPVSDVEITGRNLCDGQRVTTLMKISENRSSDHKELDLYKRLHSESGGSVDSATHTFYIPFDKFVYLYRDNPVDFRYKLADVIPLIPAYISGNIDAVGVYQFRNVSFLYPSSPILTQPEDVDRDAMCSFGSFGKRCEPEKFCECLHILELPFNTTVDLVLVNEGARGETDQTIHIHGHTFHIIATVSFQRPITSDEIRSLINSGKLEMNLVNPIEKDTVMVPHMGCVVVRLKTDNSGYWLLESIPSKAKSGIGLEMVLHVSNLNKSRVVPRNFPRCRSLKPLDLVLIDE